jgi:hypothetical protein
MEQVRFGRSTVFLKTALAAGCTPQAFAHTYRNEDWKQDYLEHYRDHPSTHS